MSSGLASQGSGISTKSSSNQNLPSSPLPPSSSGNPSSAIEQRRNIGGGNSASFFAKNNQATPRNNQGSRKNHKNHRKPDIPRIEPQVAMATNSGNRRGTSITHLMNWNIASPRPALEYRIRRAPTWGLRPRYYPVDKARYVNANYRFIVNANGDYRAQAVDSDVNIPWDMVLQVIASEKSQNANCPICLGHPIAPRMAKCGHIFCLPCLLRYMASAEGEFDNHVAERKLKSKNCPICWDSIYMNEVRPVRWFAGQEVEAPREGGDVVLRLVMRPHGSTLALPKDGFVSPAHADAIPWHFIAEVADYARIMKGTMDYMINCFRQEIQDLEVMQKEDELMFDDEGEWTRKAVTIIYNRIEILLGESKSGSHPPSVFPADKPTAGLEQPKKSDVRFNDSGGAAEDVYYIIDATKSSQPIADSSLETSLRVLSDSPSELPSVSDDASPFNNAKNTRGPDKAENLQTEAAYYFYRALPHYYLSPLDIRILKAAFGSYSSFPSTILPRIDNISRYTVDGEFRKRSKYLAHLPSGCEVAFLECDWTDIVSPEILQTFNSEIEKRRKRKKDKDAKEESDRVKAEREEEEERWTQGRGASCEESSIYPRTSLPDEASLTLVAAESQQAPDVTATEEEPAPITGSSLNSNPAQRTVWGTPAVWSSSPHLAAPRPQEDDDWQDGWDLEDDILAEYKLHEYMDISTIPGQTPNVSGKASGKKKKKKVTLMTNGGRRRA